MGHTFLNAESDNMPKLVIPSISGPQLSILGHFLGVLVDRGLLKIFHKLLQKCLSLKSPIDHITNQLQLQHLKVGVFKDGSFLNFKKLELNRKFKKNRKFFQKSLYKKQDRVQIYFFFTHGHYAKPIKLKSEIRFEIGLFLGQKNDFQQKKARNLKISIWAGWIFSIQQQSSLILWSNFLLKIYLRHHSFKQDTLLASKA